MRLDPAFIERSRKEAEVSYMGYCLWHTEDVEDDNVKLWHNVLTPQNEITHVDWSPYSRMTTSDFKLWIDLGLPTRWDVDHGTHNLSTKDLHKLLEKMYGL